MKRSELRKIIREELESTITESQYGMIESKLGSLMFNINRLIKNKTIEKADAHSLTKLMKEIGNEGANLGMKIYNHL